MSKTTILIVEDDAGLREALYDTLLLGDYDVVDADCAEAALMVLAGRKIDLVVSDIQMGEMSGLTLLKSIKAKYPQLPVLLMTAYATIDDAVQAMRDGATDYLSKPFAPEVLLNLVGRYAPAQKVESCTPIVADPSSLKLLELSRKVAKSEATVISLLAPRRLLWQLTAPLFLKTCLRLPCSGMKKARLPALFRPVRVSLNKPKAVHCY
jgi:two-component system response regulator FlrC